MTKKKSDAMMIIKLFIFQLTIEKKEEIYHHIAKHSIKFHIREEKKVVGLNKVNFLMIKNNNNKKFSII